MEGKKSNILKWFLLLFFAIVLFFILYATEDKRYIKKCFHENGQTFESIIDIMSNYYEPSLKSVGYSLETNTVTKNYYEDENSKNEDTAVKIFGNSKTLKDNTGLSEKLNGLKNKYSKDSDGPVFSGVRSVYDEEGNMLVYFTVKSYNLKSDTKRRQLILIYSDENYSGHNSGLVFDKSGISDAPFYSNWYTWSEDIHLEV